MSRERDCGGSIDQRFALSRAIAVFAQGLIASLTIHPIKFE